MGICLCVADHKDVTHEVNCKCSCIKLLKSLFTRNMGHMHIYFS